MKCPHCRKELPDADIARHLAAKGGRKSRRVITPDQQRAMQAARAEFTVTVGEAGEA